MKQQGIFICYKCNKKFTGVVYENRKFCNLQCFHQNRIENQKPQFNKKQLQEDIKNKLTTTEMAKKRNIKPHSLYHYFNKFKLTPYKKHKAKNIEHHSCSEIRKQRKKYFTNLYYNKDWITTEYIIKEQSKRDIIKKFHMNNEKVTAIMKKHNIKERSINKTLKLKNKSLKGKDSPMYGRTGKKSPNWKGGLSIERKSKYSRQIWKEISQKIRIRDNFICRKCKKKQSTQVHHIFPWVSHPQFKYNEFNLVTLCRSCHMTIHRQINKSNF